MSCRRIAALVLACLIVSPVAAQQRRAEGGSPPYDATREQTIRGTILRLETITPPAGVEQAVLLISSDGATAGVFMGPNAWLSKQDMAFAPGAAVTVVGMPGFRYNSNPSMMPRTVTVGSRTLTLRDAKGVAAWEASAGRGGGPSGARVPS